MTAGSCRIGKIRMKNGGAEVRVLETPHAGNPEVVASLISLLDRARRGHMIALAYVAVRPDGCVSTAWVNGETGHHHELASGALILACRMGES